MTAQQTTPTPTSAPERSRDRIMAAASELAKERGITGATIARVCQRSGLPVSSVYWYFEDKDHLFAEVIRSSFATWLVTVPRWDVSAAYMVGGIASLGAFILVLVAPDITSAERAAAARTPQRSAGSVLVEHRRVLMTLGVGALWVSGARAVREALVPLWAESVGLSPAQTALVFGVSGAVDMLLFYPSGWLMDRHGRVAAAVPSMLVLGLGMALLPLTSTLVAVTAAATVLGFGNGLGAGLIMTLGADASPPGSRPQFLGAWRLCADVGRAAGPVALSGLSAIMTLGAASVVLGAGAALGAVWLRIWVPRHDPTRARRATA